MEGLPAVGFVRQCTQPDWRRASGSRNRVLHSFMSLTYRSCFIGLVAERRNAVTKSSLESLRSEGWPGLMLYMVELDFIQPARLRAWDAWYMHHLEVLLTVPGFHSAQRFL